MLWGGSALLAFEHAWHGELFTLNLDEMATVGIGMATLVTIVWAVIVTVANSIENHSVPDITARRRDK